MRKVLLLIVAFITLLKATSLDEMYNNANPGEGYDKLIILEKDSVYSGGFIQDVQSVCIHGNGATVILSNSPILIIGSNKRLDIDHVIFISEAIGINFLDFKNDSYGNIINNTFYGKVDSINYLYCIQFEECTTNNSLIENNIFNFFGAGVFYYTSEYGTDINLNISNNDMWNCETPYLYWGGWTGFPVPFIPNPGNQELMTDPKFVDEASRNFNLNNLSPCIDYGASINYQYNGTAPDLGAIESEYSRFIGTKINGEIDNNLTLDKSPYIITSDITIPTGKSINIDSGVVLKINTSQSIFVNGELRVNGGKNDSVYIRNNSIYPVHWGSIIFNEGSSNGSFIKYTVIKNGSSTSTASGVLSCQNDSITISNNYFANNSLSIFCGDGSKTKIYSNSFYIEKEFCGIWAIYCDKNSKILVEKNTFYASSLVVDSADIIVKENRFMGQEYNVSQQYWLLQLRNKASAHIEANYFQNNYGAILITESTCRGYNNLLINCDKSFLFSGSTGLLSNNTIYSSGSGILGTQNSNVSVANSIVWCIGDYSSAIKVFSSSTVDAKYCILSTFFNGENILYENPLFANQDSGNFHLTINSPGINSGTTDTTGLSLPLFDYDGNVRIIENRIDIGCYEGFVIAGTDTQYESIPMNIILSYNYPNPFNPSTSIQYTISSRQYVTLKVYDMLGKGVAVLVNEEKPAGNYEINFDASKLSRGVYYYELRAGSLVQTKKMIYLK